MEKMNLERLKLLKNPTLNLQNQWVKAVIKYDGLCQGKGVFVQDDHFNTLEEGLKIAEVISKSNDDLLIEEKLKE